MNMSLPPNTTPEERRMVTSMFAVVQGFTSLAEQMDFEKVSESLKEIWLNLDQVIQSHRRYIDKHVGDGVLAFCANKQNLKKSTRSGIY